MFAEADALGHDDLPVIVSLPPILLHPDAGDLSLPQLVTSFLDARECARTVILVDTVPAGGGRALRLLSERGLQIAVTSPAAAGAEPSDLFGWLRWGVFFPQHVVNGASGIDGLTIQQTTSAIATQQTRLIARHRPVDRSARPGRAQHRLDFGQQSVPRVGARVRRLHVQSSTLSVSGSSVAGRAAGGTRVGPAGCLSRGTQQALSSPVLPVPPVRSP